MGAYTCQYGIVHKRCRCPQPHTIRCDVPDEHMQFYRGRDKMTLQEFIADVEACHFRTGHDTGANQNALMIWNIVRRYAGMPELTQTDLIQRHADDKGWTLEEMEEDYRQLDAFMKEQRKSRGY